LRGDEAFINRSIGNQVLIVSPLFSPHGIEGYSLRVLCPSTLVGTRDGPCKVPAVSAVFSLWRKEETRSWGFCVFQPHWQVLYSFPAWKLPENQNGSTGFSNIYYWLIN
jgi:hypothetical protein